MSVKKYSNDKELEVISISIDIDRNEWLKDVMNSSSKNFSIPPFILLDEKGVVINSKAPRPSSQELYSLIDSELKRIRKN
ncbi:hypothetical protein WG904_11690 [Pedobacter sp. Du54]|uniref:hypothetical protein n=1 Tax=Pedobacter anseongensis TaxID=3133439 RepID=UPI0030A3BBA7